MTFGGPAFSPTVEEEPEDVDAMEELDLRESAINGNFKSLPTLPPPTTSPSPLSKRSSRRNKPAHSTLGPLAEEPPLALKSPSKKKDPIEHQPAVSPNVNPFGKEQTLPELFTSVSPIHGGNLSHTPSPEHSLPMWAIDEEAPSPIHENFGGDGSPRRTAVKGPRSQPGRSARSNSTPKPMESLMGPGSPVGLPLITGTQGSDWRKSTDTLHRNNTDGADGSYRRSRGSRGSLVGAIGSSIIPSPPSQSGRQRSGTVRDRVTIWEDANRSASPPKPEAAHLVGNYTISDQNSSPIRLQNSIPRSLSKSRHSPTRAPSQRGPPTPNSARRGMTTPTGKALGLGIGCTATPGSLYDGDGFLRE
ncbi:hypothetical protein N7478_007620 [Penicillium angulare]|uniref:uncharacterized protein n=1 Tax=Penicillium angulare TaxID=116970 RepID=UPI0025418E35|nr:uncharacterized protein N7478_007620 [Penicillium angulare]KAJ5272495.1 hypothetical protein N7478_007620 [Penicillium angulare]